jgi:hypothetical protein
LIWVGGIIDEQVARETADREVALGEIVVISARVVHLLEAE